MSLAACRAGGRAAHRATARAWRRAGSVRTRSALHGGDIHPAYAAVFREEAAATPPPPPHATPTPTHAVVSETAPPEAVVAHGRSPEFDFDATVRRLEMVERTAVEGRRYDTAERVRVALGRLGELREKLALYEAEEAASVLTRDYDKALRAKSGTARLLTEYKALKARDYFVEDGVVPGLLDTAAEGDSYAAESPASPATATQVPVRFTVQHEINFGAHLAVVGSCPALGCWDTERSCLLQWSESGWTGTTVVPAGKRVRFKFVIRESLDQGATCHWQEGDDRSFDVPDDAVSIDVSSGWDEGGMVWICTPLGETLPDPAADAAEAAAAASSYSY